MSSVQTTPLINFGNFVHIDWLTKVRPGQALASRYFLVEPPIPVSIIKHKIQYPAFTPNFSSNCFFSIGSIVRESSWFQLESHFWWINEQVLIQIETITAYQDTQETKTCLRWGYLFQRINAQLLSKLLTMPWQHKLLGELAYVWKKWIRGSAEFNTRHAPFIIQKG
jgi:hypothetical protein